MRIIVIGASGTIGAAVASAFGGHEVVRVSRSSGDIHADITSADSIRNMFEQAGRFDAVICAAGDCRFKPLDELTDEDFAFSLSSKLMGQVNVVRIGSRFAKSSASFTLTSGVLASEPTPGGSAYSVANAGVEAFGRAAALELHPRGIRVNVISPPWVSETLQAMGQDPSMGIPAAKLAQAYVDAVEDGAMNGLIIDARSYAAASGRPVGRVL